MLTRAARELRLDLAASTMVGDKASDLESGRAVGARGVLVLTGYGQGDWEYRRDSFRVPPDHVAADLLAAVDWVLARRAAA
jgi:D-glycero-D-manno-heptose 1,7-bisphosphate phosphatase